MNCQISGTPWAAVGVGMRRRDLQGKENIRKEGAEAAGPATSEFIVSAASLFRLRRGRGTRLLFVRLRSLILGENLAFEGSRLG